MSDASIELGRHALRAGSKTFFLAARFLDRDARASAYQLYRWGRHCDDVIDGQVLGQGQTRPPGGIDEARRRLAALRGKTEAALAGDPPDDPIYIGLAAAVRRHAIPVDRPRQLLLGLEQDVEGARYRTFEQMVRYADLVAGSVAAMMGAVMGASEPAVIAGFEQLGVAVQLTNIARDVIDDANAGRVYLPLDWLEEAGVPVDVMTERRHRPALAAVAGRVLEHADRSFLEGSDRVRRLDFRSRVVVFSGALIYAEIGRLIRARGASAWDRRAVVRPGRRWSLFVAGAAKAIRSR